MVKKDHSESDWAAILTGEVLLFSLVGQTVYQYPEKDWLQMYIDEDIFDEAPFAGNQPDVISGLEILKEWCDQNKDGLQDDTITDLKVDHTHLFIGTKKIIAPPYESVYLSEFPQVFQEQTLQVRGWYRRYGLEPEKIYKEPDDHIGLETIFIAHLAKLSLAALDAGDTENFESILDAQRTFLKEHLFVWGPHWCGLIIEHAKSDFYRGIALVLRGGLKELADTLETGSLEVIK